MNRRPYRRGALAIWLGALIVVASAVPAREAARTDLRLDRVVLLMRHGVRSPSESPPVPAAFVDRRWPDWPVEPGQLTPRGARGAALMGAADSAYFIRSGILKDRECPQSGTVQLVASSAERAVSTGKAWAETFLPGCDLPLEHPAREVEDMLLHRLTALGEGFDGHRAWQDGMALAPPGGLGEERRRHSADIALLSRALGCVRPRCDLMRLSVELAEKAHNRPNLTGAFEIGTNASQAFLLEYLEGMPMKDVGWGRVTPRQIGQLLRFHPIEFRYSNRPPTVAREAARSMAARVVEALDGSGSKGRITMMSGHDTNIADLAALLELHWKIPSYPRDDAPPVGAIGFELWTDGNEGKFVRAFYRSLTMDQLRRLLPVEPIRRYVDIPGCGVARAPRSCTLASFRDLVDRRLADVPPPPERRTSTPT